MLLAARRADRVGNVRYRQHRSNVRLMRASRDRDRNTEFDSVQGAG